MDIKLIIIIISAVSNSGIALVDVHRIVVVCVRERSLESIVSNPNESVEITQGH